MHGRNNLGTITECFNTSTITGTNGNIRIGGITGFGLGGIVSNCYNAGSASGSGSHIYMGGIIGLMHMNSKIYSPVMLNCYNYGTITSATNTYVGSIVGANGVGSSYPAGTISNCYCTVGTKYSYNYYSGGMKTSTSGMVSADELKTYANIGEDGTSKLGSEYKDDTYVINNGYPVLTWQEGGFLEKQKIMASAYYDETEEKVYVDVSYTKHGIKEVITANGVELTKVDTNKYELANLNDITTTYKVIDNEGNEKELKLTGVYIIPDAQTLGTFRDEVNAGNSFEGITVIQIADIDMSTVCSETVGSWTPIGATGTYFAGTYNGNYNTISNLYINAGTYQYIALFSRTTSNTIIQNLIVENPYVYNTYTDNGCSATTLVGFNMGKIENCASIGGTITACSNLEPVAGSIVAYNHMGSVLNSFNTSTVYGEGSTSSSSCLVRIGGIIAINNGGTVTNCYNAGTVTGKGYLSYAGGIMGATYKNTATNVYPTVTNCYNYGTVSITSGTTKHVGGIAAINGWTSTPVPGTISNCYCTTEPEYNHYNNGFTEITEGVVSVEELKTYASTLGSAFVADTNNINNGYPILAWQAKISE